MPVLGIAPVKADIFVPGLSPRLGLEIPAAFFPFKPIGPPIGAIVVPAAIRLCYHYIEGYEERLLDARYGEGYRLFALAHPRKNVDIELLTYDRLQQVNGVSNDGSHTVAPSNPLNRL